MKKRQATNDEAYDFFHMNEENFFHRYPYAKMVLLQMGCQNPIIIIDPRIAEVPYTADPPTDDVRMERL